MLPFWDRKLLYVSSEAHDENCADTGMNFAGMVDNQHRASEADLDLPDAGAAEGRAVQGFLRQRRPLRAAQCQPGDSQPGNPEDRVTS